MERPLNDIRTYEALISHRDNHQPSVLPLPHVVLQEVGEGVDGAGQEDAPQVGADAAGLGSPQQAAEATPAHVDEVGVEHRYVTVQAGGLGDK